jgi:phosphate transport system substrate-binding protein
MKKGCPKDILEKEGKKKCNLMREDGAIIEAGENDTLIVQKLQGDNEKFGIFGYSYFDSNRDKAIAHTIEGVEISLEGIQDGSYPISRPLYFYAKMQHSEVIPGFKKYINLFMSERAIGPRGFLTDVGLIPLAEGEIAIKSIK